MRETPISNHAVDLTLLSYLDGNSLIDPVEVEQVDAIYPEPFEGAFQCLPNVLRTPIDGVARSESKLGCNEDVVAFAGALKPGMHVSGC